MFTPSATLILILALLSGQALASSVKGHNSAQRAVEQAPVKSAQQQLQAPASERQPKAAAPAQPILESSKKVYNDESIRRSAAAAKPVVAKSAAPVVEEPAVVAPVVAPAAVPEEPVVIPLKPDMVVMASAPVPVLKEPAPVEPAKKIEHVEPKSDAKVEKFDKMEKVDKVEKVAEKAEELPAQSMRSVPIKEPVIEPSKVIVEQVVPAKVEQQAPVVPVVSPVVVVPAVVAEPVPVKAVQQAPAVVASEVKPSGVDSPLQAKKEAEAKEAEPEPINVPAPDPGLVLSEPIDSTTKLLIDLDEHVQKFLPAEDKQEPAAPAKDQVLVSGVDYSPAAEQQPSGKSNAPLVPYSSSAVDQEPIVPPLPQSIDKVEKASGAVAASSPEAQGAANTRQASSSSSSSSHNHQNQQQVITQLLDQLDTLQSRIQDTINQLVARRRYVMSALLRPMGTYVRRVRTNLERLQNRVNQLQAAAVSVGGNQNGQRPGGFVDAAAIDAIRRRIDDISKRISDIVNRIRFSLTPTSAPMNNNGK